MIYIDGTLTRFQKRNLNYSLFYDYQFEHITKVPMHLIFENNIPIGPTLLVEWGKEDD